ncbi:MAG: Lipocalin-like domain protein [Gemmatimonadetes bacterium]|nr:Lipocalin-like domain protein [Gemmatimonadota bacterium]
MRRFVLLTAAGLLAACSSDPTYATLDLSGSWQLTEVNHSALPTILQESNPKVELLSETLVVSASGTFHRDRLLRVTTEGSPSELFRMEAGSYDRYVAAGLFHFEDGSASFGSLDAGRLSIAIDPGRTRYTGTSTSLAVTRPTDKYVYQRQ